MGTDIYMFAEVRRNGAWEIAEPLVRNSLWSADHPEGGPEWKPTALYETRNSALFGILANVSNPMHHARAFEYISEPRDLPRDVSKEIFDWHKHWGEDAFAESWLLLEELIAFDWQGKENVRLSRVSPTVAHLFPPGRRGFPLAEWPAAPPTWHVDPHGVDVRWIETYAEAVASEFLEGSMKTLRSYGTPRDVRIVFWFDS